MEKIDSLNQVAEFHKTFGHPILVEPSIPSMDRCLLRINLLQEELNELKQAIEDKDLVEVADALCDLQYVLSGAILEFGLGNKFKILFDEVQRSNMSKACDSEQEALETIAHYKETKGEDCFYEMHEQKWLVYRKQDRKTVKSKYYSPARLSELLAIKDK